MKRRAAEAVALIALAVASAVVPLVVRVSFVPVAPDVVPLWTGDSINVDFFSHQKSRLILGCGAACLLALVLAPTWRAGAWPTYAGFALMAGGILASTLGSGHRALAVWGYPGRYEGALVLGAYGLIALAAMHRVHRPRQVHTLLASAAGSALVVVLLGVAQFAGHDLLDSALGRRLLVPAASPYAGQGAPVFLHRPFTITSTLYNPNYVGSYAAMMAPLCMGLYLFAERRAARGALLVVTGLLYLLLLGSQSRAGLLAGAVATPLVVVAAWRAGRGRLRRLWLLAAVLAATAAGVHLASGGMVGRELAALAADAQSLLSPSAPGLAVTRIAATGNTIRFETTREQLQIRQDSGRLEFRDGDHVLRVRPDPGAPAPADAASAMVLRFLNRRYHPYRVQVMPDNRMAIRRDGLPEFQFLWARGGFRLLNARGVPVPAERPQEWLPGGRDVLGSGRAFIWSRTWPLLRGRLWRGDGPDTFAAHFPQDDLVPKANAFGRLDLIVDKPHSLYLQMAVNTGLVSLLGLLLVLGHYLATGARLYLAYPAQGPLAGAGASLLAAAAGYAVAALFNDSVVSVAPVFWTLLGLGLAVNLAVAESGRRR